MFCAKGNYLHEIPCDKHREAKGRKKRKKKTQRLLLLAITPTKLREARQAQEIS